MTNPFSVPDEEHKPLANLCTGVILPEESAVKLLDAPNVGEEAAKLFIDDRLEKAKVPFFDPLHKMNIPTFAILNKRVTPQATSKFQEIKTDRELFSRLLVASRKRHIPLKDLFTHELSSVPFALFASDGSYRKTDKTSLLKELEKTEGYDSVEKLPVTASTNTTVYIFDAMEIVQKLNPKKQATFGQITDEFYKVVSKPFTSVDDCSRVDVVFDRYDVQDSIKTQERFRRQHGIQGLQAVIHSRETKVPVIWEKFLSSSANKANLVDFLCKDLCKTAEQRLLPGQTMIVAGEHGKETRTVRNGTSETMASLETSQEEADTRMMLHILEAVGAGHSRVVVRSPDSDVGVLLLYFAGERFKNLDLWFNTGVGKTSRFLSISTLASKIPVKILPGLHALTGCDSVSSFSGQGKVKPWKLASNNPLLHQKALSSLGERSEDSPAGDECEDFVAELYAGTKTRSHDVDGLRYELFCLHQRLSSSLPPTADSLRQHIKRAHYQCLVWKSALEKFPDIPSPVGNGWHYNADGVLEPTMMTKNAVPDAVLELTVCKCGGANPCSRSTCACRQNNSPCIESCNCMAMDVCGNPQKEDGVSTEDTDRESDESDELNFICLIVPCLKYHIRTRRHIFVNDVILHLTAKVEQGYVQA